MVLQRLNEITDAVETRHTIPLVQREGEGGGSNACEGKELGRVKGKRKEKRWIWAHILSTDP